MATKSDYAMPSVDEVEEFYRQLGLETEAKREELLHSVSLFSGEAELNLLSFTISNRTVVLEKH